MALTSFDTFTVSYATKVAAKPRLVSVKFGDGYEQAAPDGLNSNPLVFNVVINNVTPTEAQAIIAFLEAAGGYLPFYWTPPNPYGNWVAGANGIYSADGESALIWKCKTWDHTYEEWESQSITATFEQCFTEATD